MGLSSSQGRLLMLTSRLSDIELGQIMISQRQNRLAWDTQDIAKEYNAALSNYKLTIKVNEDGERTSKNLTFQNMIENGYYVVDTKGQIYLTKDEDGSFKYPTEDVDQGGNWCSPGGRKSYAPVDKADFMDDPELLQNAIMNGLLFVYDINDLESDLPLSLSVLEAETDIEYVLDTSDDAQAQSKYEYQLARIEAQDNMYDMDMKQLETQHQAVSKEYDSVKELINSNVERTFNLFSKG